MVLARSDRAFDLNQRKLPMKKEKQRNPSREVLKRRLGNFLAHSLNHRIGHGLDSVFGGGAGHSRQQRAEGKCGTLLTVEGVAADCRQNGRFKLHVETPFFSHQILNLALFALQLLYLLLHTSLLLLCLARQQVASNQHRATMVCLHRLLPDLKRRRGREMMRHRVGFLLHRQKKLGNVGASLSRG